jgi:23S rRNA (adenine2030-N6)-methyltransferase
MNYRHLYHAGNFADVFKHCILIMLVETLCQKPNPFCYLDTHSGIGLYDLTSAIAQKTCEYKNGVLRTYDKSCQLPPIKTYQHIIAKINTHKTQQNTLQFYPGSPIIVRHLLRPQDTMILSELHPDDCLILKKHFTHDYQVAVHNTNGYQSLKAFLPPKKGRGLIFIDPPFEQTDEFTQIIFALQTALQRYPTGIYLIWYPIKDILQVKNFYKDLQKLTCKNILLATISTNNIANKDNANNNFTDNTNTGLTSCGIAIINAPWQFHQKLHSNLSWLCTKLANDESASYNVIQFVEN